MQNSIKNDTRIYAIGDIHGCNQLLKSLLDQIDADNDQRPDIENRLLIFLGDYVDRGPDSRGVIDTLLHNLRDDFTAIFLKGNHEAMMLDALEDETAARFWVMNGGLETLASYGIEANKDDHERHYGEQLRMLQKSIEPAHLDFLNALALSYENENYFFAHAGIHPDRPLDEQQEHDLLWIRDRFLFSEKDFGKIIIHGHTPGKDVDVADNQIGIDTAAVYGGKLTALRIEGKTQEFLYAAAPKNSS